MESSIISTSHGLRISVPTDDGRLLVEAGTKTDQTEGSGTETAPSVQEPVDLGMVEFPTGDGFRIKAPRNYKSWEK